MVYNYMETLVDTCLNEILKKGDYKELCRCEQCTDDIKALALNNLKPFYITGERGRVFGEYTTSKDIQLKLDVYTELTKAVGKVMENKHNAGRRIK